MRLLGAFAALLFLAPLSIGQALGSNCGNSYRISHGNSDCMHAWWDNSPSSSCWGTKGGAQSFCSNYGDITVKVDIISGSDIEIEIRNPYKWRYQNCGTDTRQISCCIDKSDLCKKSQVEMNSAGRIDHYNSSNNGWDSYKVDTHENRYRYCELHDTSIYCEVDPEGDAFTEPTLCDGETCVIQHCWEGWRDSSAYDSCRRSSSSMGFSASDVFNPLCDISTDCLNDDDEYVETSASAAPWEMDVLDNCGGTLAESCAR